MQEWYEDPHWHRHIRPDTEPAFVVQPGHGCCDEEPEDCVCVTEEDVDNWNKISALSGISESSLSGLSALDEILTSADNWNDNYNTVSSNSGKWNTALDEISQMSGLYTNSSYWQSASDTVSSNSSFWNEAYNSIANIIQNSTDISSLSSEIDKYMKLYFDTTFSGEGTSGQPYGIKNYKDYVKLINQLSANFEDLFVNGQQNWVTLDAQTDKNGINPYLKSLFSAVADKDVDQDKTLIKHSELIEWLIQNMVNKSQIEEWVKVPTPTSEKDLKNYKLPNTLYFC